MVVSSVQSNGFVQSLPLLMRYINTPLLVTAIITSKYKNPLIIMELCQLLTGMFEAIVTVEGADFACSSDGDPKSKPSEARESAATYVLRKLRQMVGSRYNSH